MLLSVVAKLRLPLWLLASSIPARLYIQKSAESEYSLKIPQSKISACRKILHLQAHAYAYRRKHVAPFLSDRQ